MKATTMTPKTEAFMHLHNAFRYLADPKVIRDCRIDALRLLVELQRKVLKG
jgi:hypothetical protein